MVEVIAETGVERIGEDEGGFGGCVGGDVFGDRRAAGIDQLERKFAEVSERAGVDAAYQRDRIDLFGYSSEVDEEALVRAGFGFAAAELANRAVSRFLLVVEDDIDIGNMLKIYFSGMDFDVDVAVRGSDALEKTKQVLPTIP